MLKCVFNKCTDGFTIGNSKQFLTILFTFYLAEFFCRGDK